MRRGQFLLLTRAICGAAAVGLMPNRAMAWGLPHVVIDGVVIRPNPIAPVQPKALDDAEQKAAAAAAAKAAAVAKVAADAVAAAAAKAAEAAKAAAVAAAAPPLIGVKVITGSTTPTDAVRQELAAQGKALETAGLAASEATEQAENVQITTAGEIAGEPGKTVVTIATGPNRLQSEFAATTVIENGEILQGANPAHMIAAPLAAALRAAESQFMAQSKPVPDSVKSVLVGHYTNDQLNNARYAIRPLSS